MKIFTQLCLGLFFFCLLATTQVSAQEKSIHETKDLQEARQQKELTWLKRSSKVRADRPLIGIYAEHHDQGIEIDDIVEGGGAGAAGLLAGDIITSVNGTSMTNIHDLQRELSKSEGGQQVVVQYLRDGQSQQANVTLKARPQIKADRPLIGIYPESNGGKGIRVSDITASGGAVKSGIKSGDVITQVNGAAVNSVTELKAELSKYKAGDLVTVAYLHEGNGRQTQVTLKERKQQNWTQERNPCDVFIGVNLSGSGANGRGVHVSGIIEETPAQASGVRSGDAILALDDVFVHSFNELLFERNKHQPDDFFTLTVLREGQVIDIEAQFKSCDQEEEPTAIDEVPAAVEEVIEEPQQIIIENSLKVTQFRAFPNPAFGNLNVQFQAEALPTTVRIVDASGRSLHRETLNQFDGYYNQSISLKAFTPGSYYLQIRQGDKVITEKVVVLPRA